MCRLAGRSNDTLKLIRESQTLNPPHHTILCYILSYSCVSIQSGEAGSFVQPITTVVRVQFAGVEEFCLSFLHFFSLTSIALDRPSLSDRMGTRQYSDIQDIFWEIKVARDGCYSHLLARISRICEGFTLHVPTVAPAPNTVWTILFSK